MRESTLKLIEISIEELTEIISKAVATELKKQDSCGIKNEGSELMTREEVKSLLRVSYTTLFHWNNNKTLKVYMKRARRVFYLKSDVMGLGCSNLNNTIA